MENINEKKLRQKTLKLNTYIVLDVLFLYPLLSSFTLTIKHFLGPVDSDTTI